MTEECLHNDSVTIRKDRICIDCGKFLDKDGYYQTPLRMKVKCSCGEIFETIEPLTFPLPEDFLPIYIHLFKLKHTVQRID